MRLVDHKEISELQFQADRGTFVDQQMKIVRVVVYLGGSGRARRKIKFTVLVSVRSHNLFGTELTAWIT